MNKVITRVLVSGLFFSLFTFVCAAGEHDVITLVYEKSGIHDQLKNMPSAVYAQLQSQVHYQSQSQTKNSAPQANQTKQLNDAKLATFKKLIDKSFAIAETKKQVIQHLNTNLSKDVANAALQWFNSPLGKKISSLEASNSTAEAYNKMIKYAQGLNTETPNPSYLKKIADLSKSTNAVESAVAITQSVQLAMATAMASSSPNFNKKQLAALTKQIQDMRPMVTNSVSRTVMISLLFTFKDLPLTDLDKYIKFYQSKSGSTYQKASMEALNIAVTGASESFSLALVNLNEQKQ